MHIDYIHQLIHCLEKIIVSDANGNECKDYESAIQSLFMVFSEIKEKERQVFFIGNGGSAAIASHMTADYMKNGGMKTYSLYDNSVTTCMGNDYGYEFIFSRPLEFLGNKDDLLVAISSSGNSQNIVNAIHAARKKQMNVITFSGFQPDNRIRTMGDWNLYVPMSHYGIVESIHNLVLQQIVDELLERDGEWEKTNVRF